MISIRMSAVILGIGLSSTGSAAAQPQGSPRDTTKATIGEATILIDYGRPFKRGRVVMDSLVPYGQIWRTGANKATHLVTNKSLMFGSAMVPAGTYTLYTVPNKTQWKLVISKQTGQWGTSYSQDQDLARVDMAVESLPFLVEQFAIKIVPRGSGGVLRLEWENTAATVSFMIH